jgi:hypothetical protein
MSRFFLRLACFLLPFALLITGVFFLVYYTGDLMPYDIVLDLQAAEPSMIYLPVGAGVPEHNQYKVFAAAHSKPEIVVVGSSRVTPFRHEMFARQTDAFYNAASLASIPETVAFLVDHLPIDPPPRILVLGVDPHFFNVNTGYDPVEGFSSRENFAPLDVVRLSLQSFFLQNTSISNIVNRTDRQYGWPALGLRAINTGRGFRRDGSFRFEKRLEDQHRDTLVTLSSLPEGASQPNPVRLAAYDRILAWATEHNVYVIGVVTPYGERYYDLIQNSPDHAFFPQARTQIAAMFAEYGFPYYDFADLTDAGWSISEMRDVIHMTDLLAARVILEVARQEPRLSAYVDLEQLQRDIAQAPNPDAIYDLLPIITPPEADQP